MLTAVNCFAQETADKKKQTNSPVAQAKSIAVSYGILVDNSGSYRMLLDGAVELVHNIVEENKADDETFLLRFVDAPKTEILQELTASKDEIHAAAEGMFAEGGQTAILDAVLTAAKNLAENAKKDEPRRRALILITDGDDRSSKTKIEDVLKFLKDEKIEVFTVGLSDEKVYTKILNRLAKESGGKSFEPKKGAPPAAFAKELAAALRVAQQ